jgi:uncharacterized membrane protein|tara:strand:+ start:297 stop:497 length:201 start_codon:yes stop_codon:yes gene_type:complete
MEFLFNIPFLPFFLILLVPIIIFAKLKKQNKKILLIEVLLILLALAFLFIDIRRIFFAEGISLIGH